MRLLKDVEESLKSDDKAAIEAKTEALLKASQKLGEKVYAEQAAQQAAPGAAAGGPHEAEATQSARNDDDVVDAEFKEVKKG